MRYREERCMVRVVRLRSTSLRVLDATAPNGERALPFLLSPACPPLGHSHTRTHSHAH